VRIRPADPTGDRAAARAVELLGAQVRTMSARVAELQADLEMVRRMLDVGSGVDPLAFEDVRTQLARLAQGQAQLELAFREDLAALAEEVRRRP
jgi:hypothetical protein